jgi:hypothetical protein
MVREGTLIKGAFGNNTGLYPQKPNLTFTTFINSIIHIHFQTLKRRR